MLSLARLLHCVAKGSLTSDLQGLLGNVLRLVAGVHVRLRALAGVLARSRSTRWLCCRALVVALGLLLDRALQQLKEKVIIFGLGRASFGQLVDGSVGVTGGRRRSRMGSLEADVRGWVCVFWITICRPRAIAFGVHWPGVFGRRRAWPRRRWFLVGICTWRSKFLWICCRIMWAKFWSERVVAMHVEAHLENGVLHGHPGRIRIDRACCQRSPCRNAEQEALTKWTPPLQRPPHGCTILWPWKDGP